ncbi:longevity assurance proteins LAG1/LAC1 [Microthyrium microscopicum]|uniref:Longevity assurance proteins LAG1/LAC1 n=1 Tax=Microthyrium microscopicum TaxID=703497 RepID=A0A6A6UL69_9PEZI|nr:longevity assurance proteins LAG1/LAC1 [Microthyrium microscopicum]
MDTKTPTKGSEPVSDGVKVRHRRKSSILRGRPRGDTGVPALATLYNQSRGNNELKQNTFTSSDQSVLPNTQQKTPSYVQRWKHLSLKHTWLNPLMICLAVVSVYLVNPSPSNPVYPALFVSYPVPRPGNADSSEPIQYGKGRKDLIFVAFYTVFLSFTREFVMQRLLRPLAIRWTPRKQARFMEQAYTALYFVILGPFGLYVMSKSNLWYFNTTAMYEGYPHLTNSGVLKGYYLFQASYWAQQMIVLLLMLEKPRKDFKELVAHHIITLSLILLSYVFHFTKMGLPVFITHDISDFFLATSIILNYMDSPIVIPFFIVFIGAWTYLRHYQNIRILLSILPLSSILPEAINGYISPVYTAFVKGLDPLVATISNISPSTGGLLTRILHGPWPASQFATIGPFGLDWATEQYKCAASQWTSFLLLGALQCLNLFWLYLIFRILWRMARTGGEEKVDDRSESDSDEDQERADELRRMKEEEKDQEGQKKSA